MADNETLKLLNSIENWGEIILKLTSHVSILTERYSWRTQDYENLAKGMTDEDIALESVRATFEGERNWNREKYPDILNFLKSVAKSKVSNLLVSHDNKVINELVIFDNDDSEIINPLEAFYEDKAHFIENIYEKELLEIITNKILDTNDELAYCVFDEKIKGFSNKEIASNNGITVRDVENAVKRIRRLTESIREVKEIKLTI